ncbi:metallophosphoesterase [Coraliomargarita sp. W4R72]
MKLPLKCILAVATLSGLLCSAQAHESHQPTALIAPNSDWKFDDDGQADAGWETSSFNEESWRTVRSPLGYGERDLNTPHLQQGKIDYYLRHQFTVKDRSAIPRLILRARYDDAFVVYLNGQELRRTHPLDGSRVRPHEAKKFETFELPATALRNGVNTLAVRLVNNGVKSSDVVWDANLLVGDAHEHAAGALAVSTGAGPQAAASDGIIRGPYLQNASEAAITIRWRSDRPTHGRVDYWAPEGGERFFAQEPVPTTEHSVRLNGLQTGSTYRYQIAGTDSTHQFRTLPPAHEAVSTRIWIIGDSGTGNDNARAVYQAYREFTGERATDVWLMLGDNAYARGTDQQFQSAVFNLYNPLLQNTCLWPAVGNHETLWAKIDNNPLTNNQADPYLAIFEMPTKGEAGGVPSGSELYYSFDYGRTHFICLDSQVSDRSQEGEMHQWLEADLAQVNDEDYDWVIAFWHHPPYTHGTHNSDLEKQHFDMRENFLPILEAHGVDLTFAGHSHTYERSILMNGHYGTSDTYDAAQHALDAGNGRPAGDGSYRQAAHQGRGTIHTVAGSSGKFGAFKAAHLPFMVENLSALASVVVDVEGRSLHVTTLGSQGEVLDSYSLLKD